MISTWFLKRARQETGSLVVFAAVSMIALFAFAALTIDVVRFCQQKRDLQSATDAAALAGALLLTNSPQNTASITAYATAIALTNGVKVSELGSITVGQWVTNAAGAYAFVPDATPYNAVMVPAQRSMGTTFGSVLGTTQMMPAVQSVVSVDAAGSVSGASWHEIPYTLGQSAIAGLGFGDTVTITGKDSPGYWGKVNPNNDLQNSNDWDGDMQSGYPGTVSVGQVLPTMQGVAKMDKAFQAILDQTVVMPVTSSDGSGTVVGFVSAIVQSINGNGNNLTVTFQLVKSGLLGTIGGGITTNAPYAWARVLVQ